MSTLHAPHTPQYVLALLRTCITTLDAASKSEDITTARARELKELADRASVGLARAERREKMADSTPIKIGVARRHG